MVVATLALVRTETRMMWNQFKRTITTPSLLMFYVITIAGIYFVSLVISAMFSLGSVLEALSSTLEEAIDRGMLFAAFGLLTASSVVGGYFGLGPAAIVTETDESLVMTGPIRPYQLFIGKYTRRVVRKMVYALAGVLAVFPIVATVNVLLLPLSRLIVAVILYFEVNYFLGGIAAYVRIRLTARTRHVARHIAVPILTVGVLLPAVPAFTDGFVETMAWPSNSFAYVLTETLEVLDWGYGPELGFNFLLLGFLLTFLVLVAFCDREYYEVFAAAAGTQKVEGRFNRILRGQVDFSSTRVNDPVFWIILKDFWSRMRSPMQVLKYVYVVCGILFVVYLNLFAPPGISPFLVTPALRAAVVPAFLLLLLLMIQVSSVTSLLGFLDEGDNIYLLKASPFRDSDIVLAKYVLGVVEVALSAIPILGFIVFLFQVSGIAALIWMAGPLVLLFAAVGTAIGSYVPVFTNEPGDLPVPLAFSFPVLNLTIGGVMIMLVASLSHSLLLILVLPLYTLALVFFFLRSSVHAMGRFK
ncbi:MAG: hypothetical protein ACFFCK_11305 [Promethearchaeota archaeon]